MPDDPASAHPPTAASAPRAFVVVRAAVAPMHAEPRVSSPQLSQALAGHVMLVHEERGDWMRVAGTDAYPAWMHRGYVTDAHINSTLDGNKNRRARTLSLGCTVRGPAGRRALPLGAWVQDADLDDGTPPLETVDDGAAVPLGEMSARFPLGGAAVAESATTLFVGTSYLWGGLTPWGADCSGFVQAVYQLHGRQLPRDARQQALEGAEASGVIAELEPADLLFFSDRDDGRITHVGIALGSSRMAHVALGRGGFAVERLDDAADPYVVRLASQRRATRRVLP